MPATSKRFLTLGLLAGCLAAGPYTWAQSEAPQPVDPAEAAGTADTGQNGQPAENHDTFKLLRPAGHTWTTIVRQAEDHLLITLGDLVYLSASRQSVLRSGEVYQIYRSVDRVLDQPAAEHVGWHRPAGKVRILADQEGLTIGRVVAARDIIQAGDRVLLRSE